MSPAFGQVCATIKGMGILKALIPGKGEKGEGSRCFDGQERSRSTVSKNRAGKPAKLREMDAAKS